jgi:hypothetical protein
MTCHPLERTGSASAQVRYSSGEVMLRLGLFSAICGLLCSCGNLPEPYAPPAQRPFFDSPSEAVHVINMGDSDAESHFVKDISPELEGNTWRWTGKRPTIRLHAGSARDVLYSIDLVIAGATFQQTGPVTLSLFVNDHLLDRVRYTTAGRRSLKKSVPAEWLTENENTTIAAEIDKVWTPAQAGGAPLGLILISMGLERQGSDQK